MRGSSVLLCAFPLLLAGAAGAQDASAEAPAPDLAAPAESTISVEDEVEKEPMPFHMSASLSHYLGQGTFVLGYADNPYFATALTLSPSLDWGDFTFGADQAFDFEWTQSDSTTVPNQIIVSDTRFSVAYGGLKLDELDVRFPLTVRVDLPLSMASRHAGKLTGVSGTAGVSWSYEPWNLRLGGSVNGNYNVIVRELAGRGLLGAEVMPFMNSKGDTMAPAACILRDTSEVANFGCGVIPRIGGLSGALTLGWTALDGALSVNANVGIGTAFSYYWSPDDEYTSEHAQPGLGHAEITRGGISASYNPVDWFSLTVGTQTVQLASGQTYMNDQPIYRWFPFWDVYTPANNYSTFYVDTTFTY